MNVENMHELIQQYIDGTMPLEKRAAFEIQLETDSILKQEYLLFRDIESELKNTSLNNFKSNLSSVADDYFIATKDGIKQPKVVKSYKKWIAVAASILLLCGAAFWGLRQTNTNSPMAYYDFGEMYSQETRSIMTEGTPIATRRKEIITLLENNKHLQVIDLLKGNTTDDPLNLLLGHAYLLDAISPDTNDSKSISNAIKTVVPLVQNKNMEIKYEAQWVLLLCYSTSSTYQSSFEELLNSIIENKDHSYYMKAKKIKEDSNYSI